MTPASYCPFELLDAAGQASPCVVISDVVMPGMNGVELALRLRLEYRFCKTLLFSERAATSDLLAFVPSHEVPPASLSNRSIPMSCSST